MHYLRQAVILQAKLHSFTLLVLTMKILYLKKGRAKGKQSAEATVSRSYFFLFYYFNLFYNLLCFSPDRFLHTILEITFVSQYRSYDSAVVQFFFRNFFLLLLDIAVFVS